MKRMILTCACVMSVSVALMWASAAPTTAATGTAGTAAGDPPASPYDFGRSVRGAHLVAIATGDADAPHTMLVVGCLHGNEPAGMSIIGALRRHVPPRGVRVWTVMCATPDGLAANTRQNARGVDLNRNFPWKWRARYSRWDTFYPGPRPASEPETRAVMRLVVRLRPDVTIWYHQHMNVVDRPFGRIRVIRSRTYAKAAGMKMRHLPTYQGTATSWQNHVQPGRAAFVVELPAGSLNAAARRRHLRAVYAVAASL